MTPGLLLTFYVLCAVASAFFSSAETAITSLTDAAIHRMKGEGRRGAERLERLRADLPKTLGTLLVGNTLANAAAGFLGAALAITAFGEKWGVLVATVLTSILLLVVSEVTPKTLAARRPEALSLLFVGPIETFVKLLSPATALLSATRWFSPFGVEESADDRGGRQERHLAVAERAASPRGGDLCTRCSRSGHARARAMVPRARSLARRRIDVREVAGDVPRAPLQPISSRGHADEVIGVLT